MLEPFPVASASDLARSTIGGVGLRAARASDLPLLRRIYRESRDAELALAPWSEAEKQRFCDSQFDLQHGHFLGQFPAAAYLVIEQLGRGIGRLYVDTRGAAFHLIDIALLREARGRGVGSALIRDLQARAGAMGKPMALHVLAQNVGARRLYERLGFVASGEPQGMHLPMRWQAGKLEPKS